MARILVIDDDATVRQMLVRSLQAFGHAAVAAGSGLEGVQQLRAEPAELALVDLMMPCDGLMTIRVLREQFPATAIIAMSGGAAHRLDYARSLGARRTLAKPFFRAELQAAIAAVIAGDAKAGEERVAATGSECCTV